MRTSSYFPGPDPVELSKTRLVWLYHGEIIRGTAAKRKAVPCLLYMILVATRDWKIQNKIHDLHVQNMSVQ